MTTHVYESLDENIRPDLRDARGFSPLERDASEVPAVPQFYDQGTDWLGVRVYIYAKGCPVSGAIRQIISSVDGIRWVLENDDGTLCIVWPYRADAIFVKKQELHKKVSGA